MNWGKGSGHMCLVPSWPFSETGGRGRGTLSGRAPLPLARSLPTSALSAWRGAGDGVLARLAEPKHSPQVALLIIKVESLSHLVVNLSREGKDVKN